MIRYLFTISLFLSLSVIFPLESESQTAVTVDAVNVTNYDARSSVPILLTVKRSRFSNGTNTTMLLVAGDDTYVSERDNNMDGAKIIGNKFEWTGYAAYPGSILHGVLLGMNKNQVVKHNYIEGVPYSFVYKSAKVEPIESTSGGHSYNIHRNSKALNIKGMSGVKLYNNTFYNTRNSNFYNIHVYENNSSGETVPYNAAKNVKIRNNIIYQKYDIPAIQVDQATCLQGFESDYNIFWCEDCEDNKPSFKVAGVTRTWEEWRAMGYDTHSRIMNPDFIDAVNLVPAARLDYGTNLGPGFEYGLATTARWNVGQYPDTVRQNGPWQVGAVIYAGISDPVSVTGITVTGAGGASTITADNGTLQLNAAVAPANATNKTVNWSIVNGTGQATISATGLVSAVLNGTVTARATATDGSGVYGTLLITITNQTIPVTGISVSGAGGASSITTDNGTLQLSAAISPSNATNKTVIWSLVNGTGQALVSATGLVTAVANGTVTARATATDGSGVSGTLTITISGQIVPVTGISVTGAGGASTITTDNGTLQVSATISPAGATNKTVTWSVVNGTGQASISTSGLVTAIANGTVTVRATANDGSGVYGTLSVTISNQVIQVTGITVTGAGGASIITTNGGTLQLSAAVIPANATNRTVTWSIAGGTGQASISSTGLVTAISTGTVTARATATDGSGVSGTLTITISNQIVPVTGITVSGAGGSTTIATDNGTLQMSAAVVPANATDRTVTWSLVNGTGQGSISATGLVTAVANGTVTARATAADGSGVYGTLTITISNQIIHVTSVTVSGTGGVSTIPSESGTLQLIAVVTPANATNKGVNWSVTGGTGQATISSTGLVSAVSAGTVTAKATASDGSGVFGTLVIVISAQDVRVSGITVTGTGGVSTITTNKGTLQLIAAVTPGNATNKTVSWSLVNGTGQASINTSGLVTAVANGTVTARATANDGSGITGTLLITISNQVIPVTGITVSGEGGITTITKNKGSLKLIATISPANATNKTVTWTLENGTGQASMTSSGVVRAIADGTVTAKAAANDGSGVYGTLTITLSNQKVPVKGIKVTVAGSASSKTSDNSDLQLSAVVEPEDATDKTVTWSIVNGTGQASISESGLVSSIADGTVTAIATANDGSGVYGTIEITIKLPERVYLAVRDRELRISVGDSYIYNNISVYNLQGNLIVTKALDGNFTVVDIGSIPPGMYIVVLSQSKISWVGKVMIPGN